MAADPDSDESQKVTEQKEEESSEEQYPERVEEESTVSGESELPEDNAKEHTLDDLADEEQQLPIGVEPSRPKSFDMNEEDFSNPNQNQTFKSSLPSSGVYSSRDPGGSKKGGLLVLLLIALLVIGGSVFLLKTRLNTSNTPTPTPTIEVSTTPSPTPTPSFDRTKYKVRVLNGTTTSGLAASVSAKLTKLGYQTDRTGNATNSAFTKTVVNVKSGLSDLINNLIGDLSPQFSAAQGSTLSSSDSADAEVILGTH